jgi:hypothetical protein
VIFARSKLVPNQEKRRSIFNNNRKSERKTGQGFNDEKHLEFLQCLQGFSGIFPIKKRTQNECVGTEFWTKKSV